MKYHESLMSEVQKCNLVFPGEVSQDCTNHLTADPRHPELVLEPHHVKSPKSLVSGYKFSFHSSGPTEWGYSACLYLYSWHFLHDDWVTMKFEAIKSTTNELTFTDGTQAPHIVFSNRFAFPYVGCTHYNLCNTRRYFSFSVSVLPQDNRKVRKQNNLICPS